MFPRKTKSSDYGDARSRKRKRCPFTQAGIKEIDYKDINTLTKFITERGKILPRRITRSICFTSEAPDCRY